MKKKVIVLLFVFISVALWSGTPQNVFIQVRDSGGNDPLAGDLTFSAVVLGSPEYGTLTQDTNDCVYPTPELSGFIKINLGQFSNWSDDDVMRVTVTLATEEPAESADFVLDDGTLDGYQIFLISNGGFQLGIIEEATESPDENGDMNFTFNHGNTRDGEIKVNIDAESGASGNMTLSQYERASYTIPNFTQTLDMGFDIDDSGLSDSGTMNVELRWNTPVPSLTNPTLIYMASDGSYWQIMPVTDDDVAPYTNGWDLVTGNDTDTYSYGVKFSMEDFTPGIATYTKWAIGENSILNLQSAANLTISSETTGTEDSSASLALSWDEVIGADTYNVEVSDSYNGTYSETETGLTSNSGSVSLTLGSSNDIKYYRIKGVANASATDYTSNAVSTKIMAGVGYSVKTTLITNNAIIAFPVKGYSSYNNASDLIGFIDECDCISQWDADTQSWNSMGRIFGDFAGWDTSLDFVLDADVPVVFNVMSGISSIVLTGEVDTSVQFTLKARSEDTVTYNYIYLPLDSSISTGLALATDIGSCTYVGKFDYDSQNWDEITTDNTADSVSPGDLLRVGITGSSNVLWPSSR